MRKRGGNLLPVSSDDESSPKFKGASSGKEHLKKKPKPLSNSTIGMLIPAVYLAFRWSIQLIDYGYDSYHLKQLKAQDATHPLFFDIPNIPYSNSPVWSRWFRFHNYHYVYNAKNALQEFGEDMRKLIERGKHPLTYDAHISNRDDPEFRHWFGERANSWLKGHPDSGDYPLNALPRPSERKALVICAGDKHATYLKTIVHSIRHIHKSYMGIRVVYRDESDLSELTMREVQDISGANIEFINLSDRIDVDAAKLDGWNLKAFAMLAVAETEIALVDADVMLYQSPDHLFHQQGYEKTGLLFYHDRVKPEYYWDVGTAAKWLQPNLSDKIRKMLKYGPTQSNSYPSEHFQEAGVIVLNKQKRMLALWAICLLFGKTDIRQYLQTDHSYGDKELYWMAVETIKEDYEFARYYPGVVGGAVTDFSSTSQLPLDATSDVILMKRQEAVDENLSLCGRLLHFDDDGKPLWSNGGYMLKEEDWYSSEDASKAANSPVLYVDGGDSTTEQFPNPWVPFWKNILGWGSADLKGENQVWALHRSLGVECLAPNARKIQSMPEDSLDKARDIVKYYFGVKRILSHQK